MGYGNFARLYHTFAKYSQLRCINIIQRVVHYYNKLTIGSVHATEKYIVFTANT
jgi:hypothetical protein